MRRDRLLVRRGLVSLCSLGPGDISAAFFSLQCDGGGVVVVVAAAGGGVRAGPIAISRSTFFSLRKNGS